MQTTVDVRRVRRWARWLAVAVALVAIAAAVLLRVASNASEPAEPALAERLGDRVMEILEDASLAEHEAHGHHFEEAATRVLCEASAFGFEPPEATTVEQVRVVYAHHMCAVVGPAFGWPDGIRSAGPIAVELTEPPAVRTPELVQAQAGADYPARIRALIPERYHEQALGFDRFVDPAVAEALRERYEDAA